MYANCGAMELAKEVYDGLLSKHLVVSTAMISGYAKHGMVKDARFIFDQMIENDLVCWSAMIYGYADDDQPHETLKLFNEMLRHRIMLDQITMLSVIFACSYVSTLVNAKCIHTYADKNGFGRALCVNNALIICMPNVGVWERQERWNKKILSPMALHLSVSFMLAVMQVLVEEGHKLFSSMINEHGISPTREYYGCMVDMYCRANLLRKDIELIKTMKFLPNVIIWGSLMSACQVHGEIELSELAAKRTLVLEPAHDGALVVLSKIYAKREKVELCWTHQEINEI
ncbi:pentatricopeptide repeat-containing protein At4g14820-like [Cicer arietinum]|uniref:pentatricopeptide repeat-containing protein At4g14820-like n=1 Tax=Cicer arietinum TaxID=3827 RepID=UPI003CC56AB8